MRYIQDPKTLELVPASSYVKETVNFPGIIPDLQPYVDQNLSERPVWVKSKKHRKQLMKAAGVREKYDYFS